MGFSTLETRVSGTLCLGGWVPTRSKIVRLVALLVDRVWKGYKRPFLCSAVVAETLCTAGMSVLPVLHGVGAQACHCEDSFLQFPGCRKPRDR